MACVTCLTDLGCKIVNNDGMWMLYPAHGSVVPPDQDADGLHIRIGTVADGNVTHCSSCGKLMGIGGAHCLNSATAESTVGYDNLSDALALAIQAINPQ